MSTDIKICKGKIRYYSGCKEHKKHVSTIETDSDGNFLMSYRKLQNVAMCTNNYDVANKKYVDDKLNTCSDIIKNYSFCLTSMQIVISNDVQNDILYFPWNSDTYKNHNTIKIIFYAITDNVALEVELTDKNNQFSANIVIEPHNNSTYTLQYNLDNIISDTFLIVKTNVANTNSINNDNIIYPSIYGVTLFIE